MTALQPTITLAEANRRVDDYIVRAFMALPPGLQLNERLRFTDDPCRDPDDGGPQGRRIASRNNEIVGVDPAAIPGYFDTLREWWLANGFVVLDNEPEYEFLEVENTADGFRMTLKANRHGNLYLIASSPCVWPEGTPAPE